MLRSRLAVAALTVLATAAASCGDERVTPAATPEADAGAPPVVSREAVRRVTSDTTATVPDWAADVVWYQIFPERFRNGDPSNDPTRSTLETPIVPDTTWRLSPWTGDWYARDAWERALGPDFYEHGVFHRRYGGDLQGVLDKLPYLDSLGVSGLYFNPVFYARSLHKYDGNTFHHVDPQFGPDPEGDLALMAQETSDPATWAWTEADRLFLRVVQEAKRRGMRVVIDGVFNHSGRDFFAFDDLRRNQQQSPYRDWYVVKAFDDPATPDRNEFAYKGWWDVDTLPEFANTPDGTDLHPGPKRYVFDATRRWMDPNGDGDPRDGIDGWRLDVAEEVPIKFWQDWNAFLRELNPEAYTSTEIWGNAAPYLREGGFSATMNYHAFAYPVKGYLIDRAMRPTAFRDTLAARRSRYTEAQQYALQNLVGSHDTDRLASMVVNAGRRPYPDGEGALRFGFDWGDRVSPRNDGGYLVRAPKPEERDLQRLVVLFQMAYVGAPMFFYGDEAGMYGADDPDDRKPMLWADLGPFANEAAAPRGLARPSDPNRVDRGLWTFYRDAIALRNDRPALRRGTFVPRLADDAAGVFAFERTGEGERLLVVLNPGASDRTVRVPMPGLGRTRLAVALASRPSGGASVETDAASATVRVPARGGLVLAPVR